MAKKPKPMKRVFSTEIDISYLRIEKRRFMTIVHDSHSVEVVCKDDGTFQVCVDDETFESGIHRFEDIYGPDPLKD